jgi:coproporphyrinogen III oxidase-like Fe-S oxidoreductase
MRALASFGLAAGDRDGRRTARIRATGRAVAWGGGTPTFLAHDEMAALVGALRSQFALASDAEISIEVDPRKVDAATIRFLASLGFNRLSIGVQDYDAAVQIAVNRIQSESQTRMVIDAARNHGFASINVDLIYGLPRQTMAGFAATLDKVAAATPDRIALYSYAHVPHLFKAQTKHSRSGLAFGRHEARDPRARGRKAECCRLCLYRHGPLREARR